MKRTAFLCLLVLLTFIKPISGQSEAGAVFLLISPGARPEAVTSPPPFANENNSTVPTDTKRNEIADEKIKILVEVFMVVPPYLWT